MTPAVITAKARAAMAIFAGLSVKRSSNSQTLKTMAAKRVDDDQHRLRYVQRPHVQADCSGSVPMRVAAAKRVYRPSGQNATKPGRGERLGRCLEERCHQRPGERGRMAKTAAGVRVSPTCPERPSTAMAPPNTSTADSHCAVSGVGCPATIRNAIGH